MTISNLEKRVEKLEDGSTEYKQGDLSTWLAAMNSDTDDGIVDGDLRLYRFEGVLYQLPVEIVDTLEQQVVESESNDDS